MKAGTNLRETLVGTFVEGSLSRSSMGSRPTAVGGVDDTPLLPVEGDIVGGCYRLTGRLGEGMFGRVYVAERTDVPEHRVALKVVRRAIYAGRNVVRELVMLAAITHPHVVQLKDHGVTEDYVWLTMPLYQGETLAERLERGPLGLREAHDVFVPITRGIQALHERGLRHQDVKPENIFLARLSDRTHPVLLDLGVAVERTATFVAGTALYGAPEQVIALGGLAGAIDLDERMDVYGIASTLLRALVGAEHFPGERAQTPYDIATAFDEREERPLRHGALPDLDDEPRRALRDAFARWLRREAGERPTAAELADELEVLLAQEQAADQAEAARVTRQHRSNRRLRFALAAVAALAAGGGLVGWSHRETLRLAGELRQAKAVGEASFDKLDTCVAAHQLAEEATRSCEAKATEAEKHHTSVLEQVQREHHGATDRLEGRLAAVDDRLSTCRREAKSSAEAFEQEREALVTERQSVEEKLEAEQRRFKDERVQLVAERDELKRSRDELRDARTRLEKERDEASTASATCTARLEVCHEERDICLDEAEHAPPPAAPPPSPAKPTAPVAPPAEPPAPDAPVESGNASTTATLAPPE